MKRSFLMIAPLLIWATVTPASAQRDADIETVGTRDIDSGGFLATADASDLSSEEEVELGRSLAANLEANAAVLDAGMGDTFLATDPESPVVVSDDAAITDYVDAVGQRLVANSDARVPFTFKVIEDASVNGLALPGGFVYVNTGLLEAAGSEAELASALAHLIAHVNARHALENQTKGTLLNIQSVPLVFVGGIPSAAPLERTDKMALPMALASFSRGAVEEADFLGLQYLYAAAYDPEAAATLLATVQAGETDDARDSRVFASHPATADRIETIRRNIAELLPPRDTNIVTTPEFEAMQARLRTR